jgi:hypothetical protein
MPDAPSYRHWVSFASGEQPFALVLPDRGLYDAFAAWLRGEGPQGASFRHAGQEMSVNFAHVQRMEVEEVAEAGPGSPGNPVPMTPPPPVE